MSTPKVTESFRRTWANQRAQMIDECEHTQSGARRDAAGIAEMEFEIRVMDALLALPVGTRFNAQDVQASIR